MGFHETLRRDISLGREVTLGSKGRNGQIIVERYNSDYTVLKLQ